MADQRIKIPKASDKSIVSCFQEISNLTGISSVSFNLIGFNNIGSIDINGEKPEIFELLIKKNSAIIDTASLIIPGFSITFYRGGNYKVQEKSGVFDEIVITHNQHEDQTSPEHKIDIVSIINRKLKAFDAKRTIYSRTPEQAQLEAIHNSTLERLETLNEELIENTHKYRNELDLEFNKKEEKLNKQIEEKIELLESEYKKKHEQLEKKGSELDQKRKELDDSSNTHARREIRRDILKEIKSRQTKFELTEGTNRLRKPIAWAMIILVALFVFLSVFNIIEFYNVLKGSDINKILLTSLKQAIYTAGAVGSLVYMIRWMNRWFELHSQSEFELKKFELDMERASWLVETSLEWKDAKGTSIPTELLESLSRNLFANDSEQIEQLQHPSDQLASALLGSASGIKLKVGDSEININPKKLEKAEPIKK